MTIRQIFAKHSNLTSLSEGDYDYMMDEEDFTNAAKELIEYHVTQALNAAKYKADFKECSSSEINKRFQDSILNSYPLDLIK